MKTPTTPTRVSKTVYNVPDPSLYYPHLTYSYWEGGHYEAVLEMTAAVKG